MGMSTHVNGIRERTPELIRKRKAVEALVAAGEPVPDSLLKFFGDHSPESILKDSGAGLEVNIPWSEGQDDSSQWIEVAVKDIPKGVERIRFTNSW